MIALRRVPCHLARQRRSCDPSKKSLEQMFDSNRFAVLSDCDGQTNPVANIKVQQPIERADVWASLRGERRCGYVTREFAGARRNKK